MAEKSISVKLSARVEQYIAAMKAAEASTTGLSRSGIRAINQLGGSLQRVGGSMTRYVTVPLAALAGGAVVMASRFDTAFAQMVGLANVPADEVDHLKESVLALAGETARSPQELADALYLAASSGLDSAAAMDVVESAAKAAASGMGSTEDVVNLLTGAIGSYGAENLTASQAVDILSAAVRDGKAAPEELAQTMGRVLPIAASMGVSLGEVGGALAFLTNTGLQTDQAVTGLRDALIHLENPGKKAQTSLDDMGTSADQLRAAIAENGLTGALQLLTEHGYKGNAQAIHELMPDIRGATVLTALLADSNGTLDGIMGDVINSAGSLGTAFGAVADTDAFKLKQAINDLKVAMTQIGDILLPIAAKVATAISDLVDWFAKLPKPVQDAALMFGVLLAATGPVVSIAGTLLKNWQLLAVGFDKTVGSGSALVSTLSRVAVVAGVAYAAWKILDEGHLNATGHIDTAADALQHSTEQAWLEAAAAAGASGKIDALAVAHQALGQAILEQADGTLSDWFSALNVSGDMALDTLINLKEWGGSNAHAQEFLAQTLGLTIDQMDLLTSIVHTGFKESDITQEMRDGLGMTTDQIMAVAGALVGLQGYAIENTGNLDDMARASLNATVQLGGTGRSAVIAAEGIAGSRLEAGNAVAVYEEFVRQLTLIDPQAAAAAVGVEDLGGTVTAAGDAIALVGPLWDALWVPKPYGVAINGLKQTADQVVGMIDPINTAAEATAELTRIASISPDFENWVAWAEQFTGATRNGEDALVVYQRLISLLKNGAPEWANTIIGQLGLTGAGIRDLGKNVDYVAASFGKAEPIAKAFGTAVNGDKAAAEILKVGDAADATTSNLAALIDEMFSAAHAQDVNMMAAEQLTDVLTRMTTPYDDLRQSTRDLTDGFAGMHDILHDGHVAFDETTNDWSLLTEDGAKMQEQTESTRDAIFAHGEALLENGMSAEDAAKDITANVKALNDQWRAAGYTEDQIRLLNAQYGLTPEQIETQILLLGDKTAKGQIGAYISNLKTIPTAVSTQVNAYPTGVEYTKGQINSLTYGKSVPITPYLTTTDLWVTVHTKGANAQIGHSAEGRFVAGGSNMLSTLGERSGSTGDEVVLPLGNKSRMSQLLGMDGVGSRVAAAMSGWAPVHGWTGGSSGSAGGDVYNSITVNMPPGSNGDDVVRALRRYQRRSGPVPISTR